MGNKLGSKRQVVDEKYTRPQGLYQHKDVDQKKLKKLILDAKLAPCYPGDDDCACDLEECPICFLYYPSLNRSRCCMKGICTECFLQMKAPNSTRPTQCPFCKTSNYAVEYRGVKTKEEKGLEQIEEQRVIEAKIRMRRQELQDDEDMMLKRTEISSSSSMSRQSGVDYCSTRAPSISSTVRLPLRQRHNREDDFDLDLEDIMVMEAIWLSIQENGRCPDPINDDAAQSGEYTVGDGCSLAVTAPVAGSSSSLSSGLACTIAALAEGQQRSRETTCNYGAGTSTYSGPYCSRFSHLQEDHEPETYFPAESAIVELPDTQLVMTGEAGQWVGHRSEVAELGATSYEGSNEFHDAMGLSAFGQQDEIQCSFQPAAGPIISESYEEQVMLAMAVSLAETRARNTPGVAWH